ncbi:immunity 50 family protein [Polaromonas sp. JS666]|uniref:immunity 50 family protein n=1 Tax=Polaromonas sp. (strain JS666 / ATCC BAA-500) TaxID=296591 RepID=UPI00059B977F|nr:immunity 50 family protein [Polaromonas sp. JS666]
MQPIEHIIGTSKVVETLGYWPTFHDAEVISFAAERALPVKCGYSIFRMTVHVRNYTTVGEGTAQYAQVLSASVLIHFLFTGACDFEFSGFNHQNVIDAIVVTPVTTDESANLRVAIESIWGFGGILRCSRVEVEAVEVLSNANV